MEDKTIHTPDILVIVRMYDAGTNELVFEELPGRMSGWSEILPIKFGMIFMGPLERTYVDQYGEGPLYLDTDHILLNIRITPSEYPYEPGKAYLHPGSGPVPVWVRYHHHSSWWDDKDDDEPNPLWPPSMSREIL